jgi:phage-related protein
MALAGGPTVTLTFKGDVDDLKRAISSIGMMVGGLGASVGVLGGIGAAAAAASAALVLVPGAFLGIGIAAAAQTDIVKNRFSELKTHVMDQMGHMTASIQGELLILADKLTATFDRLTPQLMNMFKLSSQYMAPLTDGLIALVENALPGFEVALQKGMPIVEAFSRGLGTLGTGIGGFFAALTEGTPGAVQGLDALFKLTKDLLIYLGQLIAQLSNALGPAFAALEPSLMAVVRALGDGLLSIIKTLAPYIGPLGKDISELLTAALDAMLPVINALLPLLAEFGGMLMESITPILRELGPVLAIVAKELADGLRPVIPVVAQAFRDMAPVIGQIAQEAGPLLAEVIRTLAPLFLELVKGSLELTKALLPVIPPLLEMANNAMPLVSGVINDVLIPAIKFLVTEFVGLIDYGTKIAENFAQLSVRWRTYWEEIKAAFADADAKIRAGIEAFASLPEIARRHWDAMFAAIKERIGAIVAEVKTFPTRATEAIGDMTNALVEKGKAFINGFWEGAKAIWQSVLDWFKNFPKMIIDAIGDTSKTLYNSGASLIDGFNKGVESKVESARQAGTVAVDAASNPFPQSPAKEGPFSGQGWTLYRGQSLIQGFIDGIMSMVPQLKEIAASTMAGVSNTLGGTGDMMNAAKELVGRIGSGKGMFEDLSWQGMSANMANYNDVFAKALGPGASGLLSAAKELQARLASGQGMFEDLSWKGMSANMGKYNDRFSIGASGKLELKVAPGADSALSSMLMNLVRTGQLQLARA